MTEEFLSWLAAMIAERGTLFKGIKILSSEEYKALVESEQADPDMLYLVWDEGETLSGVKILVNGEVVDEFNADTKVDRVDEPNQLYGTDENGNPTTYPTDSVGTQVKVDGQKVKEFNADEKFDKTGGVISGNVAIQGDLSVTGTTTTKKTETLNVKDNVIVANADGAEVIEDSGFAIKTSTTTAYGIMYDPVGDGVKIGLGSFDENGKFIYDDGEAQFLATRADNITDGNLPQWDNEKKQFVDSGEKIGDCVKFENRDTFVKEGLTETEETWTDEEKASACETIGALKAVTNTYGVNLFRIYAIDNQGRQQILRTTDNKNVLSSKYYVDNLPDYLALTEDTTDENGEVVEGTKTKWQDWLGVNSLIAEVAEEVKTVESIAKGANQAISFADYQTMIAALNALPKEKYNIGQSIYIGTLNVPDIWVLGILDNSVAYTYTTDEDIAEKLKTNNAVQVGHYILSPLETQKVDLTDYVKNTDYAKDGVKHGVVMPNYNLGTTIDKNGVLSIRSAPKILIDSKQNSYCPIVPSTIDYAFKVAATTNTEEWTEEDKQKARALFGIKDDLITYGTEDIGVDAPLEDGKLYLVFEE